MRPHALGSATDPEPRRRVRRFGSERDAGVESISLPGVEPQLRGGLDESHYTEHLQPKRSMCKRTAGDRLGHCRWCCHGCRVLWWLQELLQRCADADSDRRAPEGEHPLRRLRAASEDTEGY